MRVLDGTRRIATVVAILAPTALLLTETRAWAQPRAPELFCGPYANAPACAGALPACTLCHASLGSTARNVFGEQVEAQFWSGDDPIPPEQFDAQLPEALAAVEALDADEDGFDNYEEWMAGSQPGDPDDVPGDATCEGDPDRSAWQYDVCDPDAGYAYRKVMLDFCGRSPTFTELGDVVGAADPWARIHEALAQCLDSEFWRGKDGVLWQIAHRKVQPTPAIKSGDDEGGIPLADYEDDYNLFVYAHTDGHDARDVLLAQYVVGRDDGPPTTYFELTEAQQLSRPDKERVVTPVGLRAGMITSRWFLMVNTMFTALPRTTAAQAYRAFLGLDIAKLQGLEEPPADVVLVDYDDKGITEDACATCHRTLDPLTYPFSRYNGLGGGAPGEYQPDRLERFDDNTMPEVDTAPEAGWLLGKPVNDLVEWAQVAANDDAFAIATVRDYWELLVGEPVRAAETEQFVALWSRFIDEHDYDVEAMLHDLVETEAYRVP